MYGHYPIASRATHTAMAGKRFGGFKPEIENPQRAFKKELERTNPILMEAWESLKDDFQNHQGITSFDLMLKFYEGLEGLVSGLEYNAMDILSFSLALESHRKDYAFGNRAGFFLSALMNHGDERAYAVQTHHLDNKINYLGYRNTKDLTIIGDAGIFLGLNMNYSGVITLNGNAGDDVGLVSRGRILIRGDAGDCLGRGLFGTIQVCGNAGNQVGQLMQRGSVIEIDGDYRSLGAIEGDIQGGKIIHKRKIIRDLDK